MLVREGNLLLFMEMRHHAGKKVAVLVIDEQGGLRQRHDRQAAVIRTAAVLGCPVWFAELGQGRSDTQRALVHAAGLRGNLEAEDLELVLKKGQFTNVFEGTNLAERLEGHHIDYLVVLGTKADCCVHHTILGTAPKPRAKPLPPIPGSNVASSGSTPPRKPLPVLPNTQNAVSRCFVLTSNAVVNGELPANVVQHPKCLVFEHLGEEMWDRNTTERAIAAARGRIA